MIQSFKQGQLIDDEFLSPKDKHEIEDFSAAKRSHKTENLLKYIGDQVQ